MHAKLVGLPPIAHSNSKVLILGSFPGPLSLKKRQYYAYPQNHFWQLTIGSGAASMSYSKKRQWLRDNGIALWDVVRSCRRDGAGDQEIKEPVLNDLVGFLKRHRNIKVVCFNGHLAEKVYQRQCGGEVRFKGVYLPSSSPAHAVGLRAKSKSWNQVLKTSGR